MEFDVYIFYKEKVELTVFSASSRHRKRAGRDGINRGS